jgi:hypothetical protein
MNRAGSNQQLNTQITPDMEQLTSSKPESKVNQPATRRKLPVAIALGALAFGALAVGAITIGSLLIKNATVKKLHVGELTVDHLNINA